MFHRNLTSIFDSVQPQIIAVGSRLAHFGDVWPENYIDLWVKATVSWSHLWKFCKRPSCRSFLPHQNPTSTTEGRYSATVYTHTPNTTCRKSSYIFGKVHWVLLHPVYGPQGQWGLASSHRPEKAKPLYPSGEIPNGVHPQNHLSSTAGRQCFH